MTFGELAVGMRVKVGAVAFTVEAVEPTGAVLASSGRWSVLKVLPSGEIGDASGVRKGGCPRLLGYTLDDVKVA